MAQNIHLVTTIVAIMAILKIKYIWVLLEHNCCNYGNSETKDTVDSWWHNCCNCGNCGKKNKYESRWQLLSQLWQFWKILVTSIVAIMLILKTKKYTDPFSSQLSQLWQFWRQKIYGSLFITIAAIMAILKRYSWLLMTAIVAIVAIVEKTKMNPGNNNCRNYGNSENC